MAQVVVMPKLGLTMTEGTITKWHKKEGDEVRKGEILFELTTEKITYEVEADVDGVLKVILVKEWESVSPATPVAIIAGENESITSILESVKKSELASVGEAAELKGTKEKLELGTELKVESREIKASPAAKKLAKEKNIDLREIKGTGPDGRILLEDAEEFIKSKEKAVIIQEYSEDENDEKVPLSPVRKTIAEKMVASWNTIPAVTYGISVDMTELMDLKEKLESEFEKKGVKLTYNHFLIKICSVALKEMPYMNSTINGNELIIHKNINIGMAVAREKGLIVPNLKNVEKKSLFQIAKETEELIEKARKNSLSVDELTGGTFTITNLGMYGIEFFSPIINLPEVAILGITAITNKPSMVNGQIVIKPTMVLNLTADHRVVDGADAAKFLLRIKELIEKPYLLIMD
ncbi:Pyruvate/2-oxoglutarate dehydrogenase complex, dihydrolipoamide acyltransferase (E2) component [Thermoanaerobacter sp. YS13]|uniref:dihydrolipoamide acetyltransferase family protein n=1 Tax=Thermoanaerobacter sp. YS13 TaxID=1511746 RepID=UPI000575424E|nr:dihydrolipoamide acetyltransferase family protein [Thermoanaerobacter sp. YS13]KHO62079.1 Pyruvate/2-oxoglutarate dehydrogenase complex, dihydrolipoamide acyltransferase (E2) component [Thermoanaerobacter sp. YS13]